MRVRSPLLAQSLLCFLLLQVLRCFSSLGLLLHLAVWFGAFSTKGCPIRISTDHELFALPRSFSQLITSFFASESLGIPHTLFLTSFIKYLRTYLCARIYTDASLHQVRFVSTLLLFHQYVNELLCQYLPCVFSLKTARLLTFFRY